jgi:hypothetical protein
MYFRKGNAVADDWLPEPFVSIQHAVGCIRAFDIAA